ncbi:tyrosine-protein phosphatase non-receptor type 61F isoform X1 [Harmonia axyridis]|uniref:tyrosine-protein phosphatase non-receptor type 61F isoform X1 n=1 Tax=Harmonia axyridis TaxID=115357 RepID=UPI001E2791E6|nr:tyrosine-protein phosphatase non-receptor type 61F isoform X1 [Harmonia axyridis]
MNMTGCNNIEQEYSELNRKNEWTVVYKKIREQSLNNSSSALEAVKGKNKPLNRYRDVSPYDHSRIVLKRGNTDYINANLIKIDKANRKYILTQGPLPSTVSHFWLMVWEQESRAILMLNKLIENKQEKCYQYWPMDIGPDNALNMPDVNLSVEYIEQHDYSYYLTRLLRLTDLVTETSRDILQFHYTTWPDFGVPSSPTAFLQFLHKVRNEGVLESDVGPAIVHCSAGIGRSGTFCLVDSCLVLIEKHGLESVNVKEILLDMRQYRMGLIQTPEQLRFSYQAIIEGAKKLDPNASPTQLSNHIVSDNSYTENNISSSSSEEDNDEPPPLPPPRSESLNRPNSTSPVNRPLPKIPNSVSLSDISYEQDNDKDDSLQESYNPSGPLPTVPGGDGSSEDELIEEAKSDSDNTEKSSSIDENPTSLARARQRFRQEKKDKMEAKVREMKRRQQVNEHWTQLKRSLYKPLLLAGTLAMGGGILAYFYLRN